MSRHLYAALPVLLLAPATWFLVGRGGDEALAAPLADDLDQEELERLSREIAKDLEVMRGVAFDREVAVSLANREDFIAYAVERLERMTTPEELAADEAVAKLLGLVPPDMDLMATTMEVLEEQVGGFYDPSTKSFCLMESFDGDVAKVILAHELTHALDDQLYDIDGTLERLKDNTDALTAYQAVVEGSGTAVMNQWLMQAVKEKKVSLASLQDMPGLETEAMAKAPQYIWKPLLAVYMRGACFIVQDDSVMTSQLKKADPADIERAFTEPPRSTEQVLHFEKYWDPEQRDEPRELELSVDLPEGWTVAREDTLGEVHLALVTTLPDDRKGIDVSNPMSIVGVKYTNDAATGWGGDRFVLLERGDAKVLHLVSVWDTGTDATEFQAALEALGPHLDESNLQQCLSRAEGAGTECRSGSRVTRGPDGEVALTSWFGVDTEELEGLLDRIRWTEVEEF